MLVQQHAMRALDLFSGIGGLSLALQSITYTIAYCEIDGTCQQVLAANMRSGKLHTAPIYPDITKLTAADIQGSRPDIIVAGFPCQDVSCLVPAGTAAGVHGSRSSLFQHIIRLARALPSVKYIFLENSPCLMTRGGADVLGALQQAGFKRFAHGLFSARDVGAPHLRRRWFCLASKLSHSPPQLPRLDGIPVMRHKWLREKGPKLIPKPISKSELRCLRTQCSMLGNAVVPQAACMAYALLCASLRSPIHTGTLSPSSMILTDRGAVMKADIAVPSHTRQARRLQPRITMMDDTGKIVHRSLWRTPVHALRAWSPCRTMTDRALWNLVNMIFFEENSVFKGQISDRPLTHTINPRFIEYLMGYPPKWTAYPCV